MGQRLPKQGFRILSALCVLALAQAMPVVTSSHATDDWCEDDQWGSSANFYNVDLSCIMTGSCPSTPDCTVSVSCSLSYGGIPSIGQMVVDCFGSSTTCTRAPPATTNSACESSGFLSVPAGNVYSITCGARGTSLAYARLYCTTT